MSIGLDRLILMKKYRVASDAQSAKYDSMFAGCILDILFSPNHNIHKSSCGLCFWATDPSIDRF